MTAKKQRITLLDFSGIYHEEQFSRNPNVHCVDCRSYTGVCGYCDDTAAAHLRIGLESVTPEGIHFIDGGNYHYLTAFFLEKLSSPLDLVVFDHHTDMQKPLFTSMLTCGSWIREVLDKLAIVHHVFLLGAAKAQLPVEFQEDPRIFCCSEEELNDREFFTRLIKEHATKPLYISIDKDVLNPAVVKTDWDQGSLNFTTMCSILHCLISNHPVIGVDICGECPYTIGNLAALHRDDDLNTVLLRFLQQELGL